MPTNYSDIIFCTSQDVINYINSSEIVLQRGRADNSFIGVSSVDTSLDKITTGVLHQFIANDSVQFASSGTLPAPLVAGTDYFVIAGFTPTTFQVSLIRGGAAIDLTTAGTGNISVRNTTVEKIITLKLGIAKNDVFKYDLIKEAKKRFSVTVGEFLSEMYGLIDDAVNKNNRGRNLSHIDEIPQYSSWAGSGAPVFSYNPLGFFWQSNTIDSVAITTNTGIPDSSVKRKAGSIVLNINSRDEQFPYVNRGTYDAPSWEIFQPKDLINYLNNPEALKMCMIYCTLMLMARDGMFANRMNYQDRVNAELTLDGERLFALLYDEEKYGKLSPDQKKRISDGNFSLIEWDIAGNGIITDYSLSKNSQDKAWVW